MVSLNSTGISPQLSVTVSTAASGANPHSTSMYSGGNSSFHSGSMVSTTVKVAVVVAVLPHASVAVKRTVTLRKDEYFVDGKKVTKTEVASLLESAGLSRSNPTHIVPQGRVMALTTMKDEARLEMLRDVSGASACAPLPDRAPRAPPPVC